MSYLKKYLANVPSEKQSTPAIAFLASLDHVNTIAPTAVSAIIQELKDQRTYLKLIASENYSSLGSQLAMGNLLNDKAAEGYAHHRFFSGCENIDLIEAEAVELLKTIYGCEHAYVQCHSGSDANLLAYWTVLIQRVQTPEVKKLGKKNIDQLTPDEYEQIRSLFGQQKIMGMSLTSGGHLSHGFRHHVSSKMMQAITYDVDPQTECINYQTLSNQVREHKPLILLAGYSAHPRRINFAKMREIADQVDAVLLVDMSHFAGFVAGKVFCGEFDPIPYAHIVTSTTYKTLRGPRGAFVLCTKEFSETVNKGCPMILGSPASHIIASKLVAFTETNTPEFHAYARQVVDNAFYLAERLMEHKVRLITGGTENHLMILDVTQFGLNGRQAESALRAALMTVNRNTIPFDVHGSWYTSGIRIGTQAITSLGMGKNEMLAIADVVVDVLSHTKAFPQDKTRCEVDQKILEKSRARIQEILQRFPLYPEIEI